MKIVQVGLGNWGKNHNRILKEKGCEVVAVEVEQDFKDYISLNFNSKPDAVFVTTSSVMHFPVAYYCLTNMIPVFCEKPIVTKRSQIELLKNMPGFFMSGHQLVFADEIQDLKDKNVGYMSSIRSGAIAMDEGAVMSLAVHDIAILHYLKDNKKYEVKTVQGNKHEAHIYLEGLDFNADIYVRSLSEVKLRHSTFVSFDGNAYRVIPECWNRQDLLDKEITYFLDCVEKGEKPTINDLDTSIRIMETVFDAKEMLEKGVKEK